MLPIRFFDRLTVTVLVSLYSVSFASASEPPTPEVEDSELVAVFRISGKLFENTINRTFNRNEQVDMCILDVYSVGDAHVKGKATVGFSESKLDEPLTVEITGEIQSSSVGYTKPIIAGARTFGTFRALVGIDFDGKQFCQAPTTAEVSMQSTVDWVIARRRGLGRRLIQRVAARVAPRTTPKNTIVRVSDWPSSKSKRWLLKV